MFAFLFYLTSYCNSFAGSLKISDNEELEEKNIFSKTEYSTQVNLDGKVGLKRFTGRIGLTIPLFQYNQSLLFTTIIGMTDNNKNIEGNFGLGYRHILHQSIIVGGYGFFDYRRTLYKNFIKQLTLGFEIMTSNFEFRGNLYLPENKSNLLGHNNKFDARYINHRTRYHIQENDILETPMHGFDFEVGGNLPSFEQLQSFVAYYRFFAKNVSSINGVRIREEYKIFDWLSFGIELNYDNLNKWTNYFSIKLNYIFGSNNNSYYDNWINHKITQMPIRDLDIFTKKQTVNKKDELSFSDSYKPVILSEKQSQKFDEISGNAVFGNIEELNSTLDNSNLTLDNIVIIDDSFTLKSVSSDSNHETADQKDIDKFNLHMLNRSRINENTQFSQTIDTLKHENAQQQIQIIKGDITNLAVDAIVNAANSSLLGGGGVDGAIHDAAGTELLAECRTLGGCLTGQAKITKGYNLPTKHVIHTVGPVWSGGNNNEPSLLKSCYENSLKLAIDNQLNSIAFPSISTGAYGYLINDASKIAINTTKNYIANNNLKIAVTFVCFSDNDYQVYLRNFASLK
jgi:O-acetyl-ADP-ribose deacetylase (regulator of RNase III)